MYRIVRVVGAFIAVLAFAASPASADVIEADVFGLSYNQLLGASDLQLASASTASRGPRQDALIGGGQNNPATGAIAHFAFGIHSEPDGTDTKGNGHFVVTENQPNSGFWGPAVCLRVIGNRASAIIDVKHAKTRPPGGYVEVYAEDNGNPIGGMPVDRVENIQHRGTPQDPDPQPPAQCPFPRAPIPPPITKGNIHVRDAL